MPSLKATSRVIRLFPSVATTVASLAVAVSDPPLARDAGVVAVILILSAGWLLQRGIGGNDRRLETRKIVVDAVANGLSPMVVMAEWSITRRALNAWTDGRRGPFIWWTHVA